MEIDKASAEMNLVAQVLIDSVGLSKVFTYLVPEKLAELAAIGNFVSVPLGNSRAKGWIVGVSRVPSNFSDRFDYEVLPLYRVLGGGPSQEVVALCKWAAWRFIGSPVSFLTHASPKKRIAASQVSAGDFAFDFETSEQLFIDAEHSSRTVRIPPSASRLEWLIDRFGSPDSFTRRALVVCPTQKVVDQFQRGFKSLGFSVATYPDELFVQDFTPQIVVGARNSVFASIPQLDEVIVVDGDEPSHKESSSPYWDSSIVAKARTATGVRVTLLSSAPTIEMCFKSQVMSLPRAQERDGWPKVAVADLCDEEHNGSLISPFLTSRIKAALQADISWPIASSSDYFDGVLVLYNRLGGARTLVCSKCKNPVVCVNCSTTLMQVSKLVRNQLFSEPRDIIRRAKESVALNELVCPNCKSEYPAICTNCLSSTLKVVTFGIRRFALLLQTALKLQVQEMDASSSEPVNSKTRVVVGTEALFSRFSGAKMVVIADFDHYLFSPTMDATQRALSVLARASRLVPARSTGLDYVPLYLQTRDPSNLVIRAAIEGDPRRVVNEESELRKRLGLPPFGAVVRVCGKNANLWIEKSGLAGNTELQIIRLSDQEMDLRLDSKEELLDMLAVARAAVPPKSVKFIPDPV